MEKDNICPICENRNIRRKYKSNYDEKKINEFGFASRKMPEYVHYTIMECMDCHFLFAVDTFDVTEIGELYKEADYDSSEEADFAAATYWKYLKKNSSLVSDRKIESALDIGTGNGSMLKQYIEEGKIETVWGVEPSVAPVEAAEPEIKKRILNKMFCVEDFLNQKFDLVSCFQTLEHCNDPETFLGDMSKILKEGGGSLPYRPQLRISFESDSRGKEPYL